MGFYDEASNIRALQLRNGDVNYAVEYLLANPVPAPQQNQQDKKE